MARDNGRTSDGSGNEEWWSGGGLRFTTVTRYARSISVQEAVTMLNVYPKCLIKLIILNV